jgi:TrkA domain protein
MTVYETEVPGVGRKFEVDVGSGGERLIVLIHHGGRRELFYRPTEGADSERIATLTGEQARRLGTILEGSYFQPIELDTASVPLGEGVIEWLTVDPDSPLAGTTIGDAGIRAETGVNVIAVQRDAETVANPDPSFTMQAGDVLVGLGTRAEQDALEDLHDGDDG